MENLESDPEDTLPFKWKLQNPIQFNEYTHESAGRSVVIFMFIVLVLLLLSALISSAESAFSLSPRNKSN